jgi:crotonobetainyl-CoA:carnitine CoA-transferase CaiB-like acyl-CoA transferase
MPLSGIRVLDFSTLLPGPFGTMMLADLGAEVVRVESPTRIDLLRVAPPYSDVSGTSIAHSVLNRSKKSIALDLKVPESVKVVKELVKSFDVVVEQFRPGVMDRLGVGYDVLSKINPKLVYCSITGYGQTGPYKTRAGHDNNYLSISGINSHSGSKTEGPFPLGFQIADVAGGSLHGVIGILAALLKCQRTGEGDFVDISMTDASFALNSLIGADYVGAGNENSVGSTMLNGGSFYGYYKTKDGRYFSVGGIEPQFTAPLFELVGLSQQHMAEALMIDSKLQPEIKETITNWFSEKTFAECSEIFSKLDICVEPVLSFSESCEHEHIVARDLIVDMPNPEGTATEKQIASPIKFKNSSASYLFTGKKLGEDSESVLSAHNYSKEEIEALAEKGVFGPTTNK